jgi:RNA-directed DNA polymerase
MRDKDFRSEGGTPWAFCGPVTRTTGTPQDVRLCRASRVPMRRHTKIKGEANPDDPQWEPSCEARLGVRRAHHLKGRRSLLRLWKEQDGLGAVCHPRITTLTGWHSHHLVWRTPGGSDRAENRAWLHPNGHAQVHSQGLPVVKPRPPQGVGKAGAACRETCTCRSAGAGREQSRPATRRVPGNRHSYRRASQTLPNSSP